MTISIASGKGGTGKTTVAAGLVSLISDSVYIDCDVEEPNGHLLLHPVFQNLIPVNKKIPVVNRTLCTHCNVCKEACEFNAIIKLPDEIIILEDLCHSCGACTYLCPQNAITEVNKSVGLVREGTAGNISFIDGVLNIGEPSASPVIKELKNKILNKRINILDSPPGTSCSMIETVKGSDYCILVTESNPFGLHDLKLAINLLKMIKVPFGVIVNKYDSSFTEMEIYLDENFIDVLLTIPFDRGIAGEYSKGEIPHLVTEKLNENLKGIFERILILNQN
jgi:MinD superfamily P-loop ATPase